MIVVREEERLYEGLDEIEDDYEFADLGPEDLDRLAEAERLLAANRGKDTILLAFEKRGD